jgi:hypothetical protein
MLARIAVPVASLCARRLVVRRPGAAVYLLTPTLIALHRRH